MPITLHPTPDWPREKKRGAARVLVLGSGGAPRGRVLLGRVMDTSELCTITLLGRGVRAGSIPSGWLLECQERAHDFAYAGKAPTTTNTHAQH